MAKAKQKSTAELKDLRAQLEIEVNEAQKELAEKKYSVNLENIQNINAILKQIDKNYEWSIKNAAFVINLYDALADQKKQFQIEDKGESTVQLNGVQLNQLYTIITNITGTGIEAAKTFTRLLTNVGAQISDALKEMAEANKVIQEKHVQLAELDVAIDQAEKPEVAVEEITQ
jgi:hypothetical protein